MNIRKNTDYNEMYESLGQLMARQFPQVELYSAIGKAVCRRTEKGAAVMAAEYLHKHYPDVLGFSPRNVRRMRDFYRTYENHTLYHAIFIKQYSGQNYETEIGKISIRRDSKEMILRTISALSNFADFEV